MTKSYEITKKQKMVHYVILFGAVLIAIKGIFIDIDIDGEYALAMSGRMLKGDRMFLEMWEPHQTSAWLCTVLMWIFEQITGSTTGVAVYLHAIGAAIYGIIAYLFYRTMCSMRVGEVHFDKTVAFYLSVIYFTASPKDVFLPEFSNMLLWFTTILMLCLIRYLQNPRHKIWLLWISISLSLAVIAYPTSALLLPVVLILLHHYGTHNVWDCLSVLGLCLLFGILYVLFFIIRIGWQNFRESITMIVSFDASHASSFIQRISGYAQEFVLILLTTLIYAVVAAIIVMLYHQLQTRFMRRSETKRYHNPLWIDGFWVYIVLALLTALFIKYFAVLVFIPLLILSMTQMKKVLTIHERRFVVVGLSMGTMTIVAVLFVTNLPIYTMVPYGVLCFLSSMYILYRVMDQVKYRFILKPEAAIFILLCLTMLERGIMIKDLSGAQKYIWRVDNVVKSGPLRGIFCSYMGAYIKNSSAQEWSQYIHDGESVLLVEEPLLGTSDYLRGNTQIAVPSTICTPTFNEKLLWYWDKYPEKYPDVIAVSNWYGDFHVADDSWIMNWIETEYQPSTYTDGSFWRFYRRVEDTSD